MKKIFWIILIIIIIIILCFLFLPKKWRITRITNSPGNSRYPAMVWDGSGYGIVWSDNYNSDIYETYFTRVDEKGERLIDTIKINRYSANQYWRTKAAITWTGSEYGIVWPEGCKLYFARFDTNGVLQGHYTTLVYGSGSNCPYNPSIKWSGSEYGIIWNSEYGSALQIFFIRLNALGNIQGNAARICNTTWAFDPSMTWSGSNYGITWQESPSLNQIFFTLIDSNGNKQLADIRINSTTDYSYEPSIDWNSSDSNYGIVWDSYNTNIHKKQIYFAGLDNGGGKIINDTMITSNEDHEFSTNPSICWADSNSEYGLVWQFRDLTSEKLEEVIQFVPIDKQGNLKDNIIQVSHNEIAQGTTTLGQARNPVIVWNGSKYAVVWDGTRDSNFGEEIYFATQSCSILDKIKDLFSF